MESIKSDWQEAHNHYKEETHIDLTTGLDSLSAGSARNNLRHLEARDKSRELTGDCKTDKKENGTKCLWTHYSAARCVVK